jgi:hypothetical protein
LRIAGKDNQAQVGTHSGQISWKHACKIHAVRNGISGNGDRDLKRRNRNTSEESGASTEWGVSLLLNSNHEDERIPIDSGLIFPFAVSVLVSGHEQLLL